MRVLLNLLFRKYNTVILPSYNLGWILHKKTGLKVHIFKSGLAILRKSPFLLDSLRKIFSFCLKKTKVVILDRHYFPYPVEGITFLFEDFYYFKTHYGETQRELPFTLDYLPMWITDELISRVDGRLVDFNNRKYDCSFVGSTVMESRKLVLDYFSTNDTGLESFISTDALDYSNYIELLLDSCFVISPSGAGWHCFRHYEALAAGAIPIIDRPLGIISDMVHGSNCLFYDTVEEIPILIEAYKTGAFPNMLPLGERLEMVKNRHLPLSVGQYILETLSSKSITK